MQHYTVGFILSTCRRRVLLLKKDRPAQHKDKLNGIGGKIEPPETQLACIKRECQEETGLIIQTWYLIERGIADDGGDLFIYTAMCPRDQTVRVGDAGQAFWCQIAQLPHQVLPDVPRLVHIAARQSLLINDARI